MKNIPFFPGLSLGIGYNPLTERPLDSPFQEVKLSAPQGATGQEVEFGINTVTSTQDLSKKLNLGASVSLISGGPFSNASAAARLLREHTVSAHHLYLLVSVVVTHSSEVLTTFTLKPKVLPLLEDKTLDQFYASYGSGFITGFVKGGYYYGLIEIQTNSLDEKRKLSGKLDGQVFAAVSAQLEAARYLKDAIADKKTQISIFRSGGLSKSTGVTLEEMLHEASTFPNSVAENPSIIFALYRDYEDIQPFSQFSYLRRKEHQEYVQCIERLETLYLQYRDYHYALRSLVMPPDGVEISSAWAATEDMKSAIATDLAGVGAQMETIESLINSCKETAVPCAMPTTLYQLSPQIKNILNAWIEASEGSKRIKNTSQVGGRKEMAVPGPHYNPYYNVAVVGITGVGKSALVNYLFGQEVAATGLGRPVTKRGFQSYEVRIDNLPVRLFDSWGLEVNNVDEWIKTLDEELSLRGTDRPAEEWFHTILYCVNAGGSRIHDPETRIIKRFLESKYQVVVILTKADVLNKEDEAEFTKKIRQYTYASLPVIAACSKSGIDRRGATINTFGKEEIEAQIYDNFWDTIIARLPQRCRRVVEDYLNKWESNQIERIRKRAKAGDSLEAIQQDLSNAWDEAAIEQLVREEISRTIYVYGQISQTIEYSSGNQRLRLDASPSNDRKYSVVKDAVAAAAIAIGGAMAGASLLPALTAIGSIVSPMIPIVVALQFVALPVAIWRKRVRDRSKAVDSLVETVRAEIGRLKQGLDAVEKGIENSLKNLRRRASK